MFSSMSCVFADSFIPVREMTDPLDEDSCHQRTMISALYDWNPENNEVIYLKEECGFCEKGGEFATTRKVSSVYRFFAEAFAFLFGWLGASKPNFYKTENATPELIYKNISNLSRADLDDYLAECLETSTRESDERKTERRDLIIDKLIRQMTLLDQKFTQYDLMQTDFAKALISEKVPRARFIDV